MLEIYWLFFPNLNPIFYCFSVHFEYLQFSSLNSYPTIFFSYICQLRLSFLCCFVQIKFLKRLASFFLVSYASGIFCKVKLGSGEGLELHEILRMNHEWMLYSSCPCWILGVKRRCLEQSLVKSLRRFVAECCLWNQWMEIWSKRNILSTVLTICGLRCRGGYALDI